MGRNRKPAKAVAEKPVPAGPERIFDDQGNPIGPRANIAGQPDWFPYDNTNYFNAAMLPPQLQKMIKGGGKKVYLDYKARSEQSARIEREKVLREVGLDLENPKDCQIYADLMSIFKPVKGVDTRRYIYPAATRNDPTSIIGIGNSYFRASGSPEGTGYAMVARQVAAAQEVARRTGNKVVISVGAAQGRSYNGVATWPKLGYEFDIPWSWRQSLVYRFGFKPEDVDKGTSHFMDKRNNQGQQGWDVWRRLVEMMGASSGLYGKAEIYPDGRVTPALHITREYGKRKGYNKALRQPMDSLFSEQGPSAEDDATLKAIWMGMKHGS